MSIQVNSTSKLDYISYKKNIRCMSSGSKQENPVNARFLSVQHMKEKIIPKVVELISCIRSIRDGIKINGQTLKNKEILSVFKNLRSYTPIGQSKDSSKLEETDGIKKSEVFVTNRGKTTKIYQYEFNQESRDHRTAIAILMRYYKEKNIKTSYVIKPYNSESPLRITNPFGKDVLMSPIKDNTTGNGTKEKPYQFTKGLNYSEIKEKLASIHVKSLARNINLAERARSDNGALLLQITQDKTKSIAAYNTKINGISGPKAMQEVSRSNRFDNVVIEQCKEYIIRIISSNEKYYAPQIKNVKDEKSGYALIEKIITERRQTPSRSLLHV